MSFDRYHDGSEGIQASVFKKLDSDYVADYWEIYNYYTDPTKADSDGDGAPDWFEISYMGYDKDTDGDGIANPWDWDSDGDLIADGKEIEINPTTEDITILTNPLVYNDFDEDKTEIRQNIERDALSVSDDNRVTVVVDYEATSSEKPQIQKVSDYAYQMSSSITENLKAEIRMKLDNSMIQELNNDPYKYRMYYYDITENQWEILRHTDVDLDNGYIWGVTEHFSIFAIKNTAIQDTDGDGLTDEYEMTTEYIAYYESCDGDVTWGQLGIERGYKDVIRWTVDAYNGASSWKMGGEAGSYYMYSPAMNISMDEKSHATISFHYKYRNPSGQACYSLYFLSGWSKLYPGEDMIQENSGPWRTFSEDIYSKITSAYTYYKMPSYAIPLNRTFMEFYAPNSNNYILIDEIEITAHTDLNNPDTDGDGLYDGWNDANGNGVWDSNEEKGEIGDPNNNKAGGYGTNPFNPDTDGDGWKDGKEVKIYKTNPLNQDTDRDGVIDSNDADPLVDLSVTLHIKSATAYEFSEPADGGNPDIYFKVYWNTGIQWSSESVTQTFWGKRQVTDVNIQVNVPDYKREVYLQIFMMDNDDRDTELNNFDDPFDINSIDGDWSLHISYDPATGRWTDEDYIGDYDGYGHSIGDGSDAPKGEIWFDITQNDYDGDGLAYWEEVNIYGTNPTLDNTGDDLDGDGMPIEWEDKYGLDDSDATDAFLDPDNDGLTNLEECCVRDLGSDPYYPDLFVEIDYLTGHRPHDTVLNYIVDYYRTHPISSGYSGIHLVFDVDEEIPLTTDNQQMTVQKFFNIKNNHFNFAIRGGIYRYGIFGDKDEEGANGWAWAPGEDFFIADGDNDDYANDWWNHNIGGVTETQVEKVVLMHELGHCINIIDWVWINGEKKEDYCDNSYCVMALINWDNCDDNPYYCDHHWSQANPGAHGNGW